MHKAIFSKVNLEEEDQQLAQEYLDCVKDLLSVDGVQGLKEFSQHMNTTRYQHSLNVSYYTFLLARKLHLNTYSAARAGLLHDMYHYDWRELDKNDRPIDGRHCSVHPKIALENAKKVTAVNNIIEDAIVHHMWPMTLQPPKTKEGWLLQAVDKGCAISEVLQQSSKKLKPSYLAICAMSFLSIFTNKAL